jgi:hypothetical protein
MLRRITALAEAVTTLSALALAAAFLLTGCASEEKKAAPAPAPTPAAQTQAPTQPPVTLREIKTDLINAKAQLATTTNALTALKQSTSADAQNNYNTYAAEYVKLQQCANLTREHAKDLRTRSKAYYDAWSNEKAPNPEIQRKAIEQRAEANKTFSTITSEMDLARLSFDDYMKNSKDVGSYLKDSVAPARIQAVSDLITKVEGQSTEVTKHIDAIIGGVDQMVAATQ